MKSFLIFFVGVFLLSSTEASEVDAVKEEIFDLEEIILVTLAGYPRHFRVTGYKYYYYLGDEKRGPLQVYNVEMYSGCEGVVIDKTSSQGRKIGWTTANETIADGFYRISSGARYYHRIDLSKLEYQYQFLGSLNMNGDYSFYKNYGKDGNENTYSLMIVNENWSSYFKNNIERTHC
jgi:hypothetical protein